MELKQQTFTRNQPSCWFDDLQANAYVGEVACDAAEDALTHGGVYPLEHMKHALGAYDRAALAVLKRHRKLRVDGPWGGPCLTSTLEARLSLYVNTHGRLHIRPSSHAKIDCKGTGWIDVGHVTVTAGVRAEIDGMYAAWQSSEAQYFTQVRTAMDGLAKNGGLTPALDQIIAQIDHIDSLCFYIGDRYVTLIDESGGPGFLHSLREKAYADWSEDDLLIVAAFHVLVRSGRVACFDEFNGALLSARDLIARIEYFSLGDTSASRDRMALASLELFDRVTKIRALARI
jgi:hypothetical protein